MSEVPETVVIKEVQVMRVLPGDVIIYKSNNDTVMEDEAHRIIDELERVFPDNRVIVIAKDCELVTARLQVD